MVINLRCVPPSVTAQQKRVRVVRGKPVFFHGWRMRREVQTWAALLAPHVPPEPLDGPIGLSVTMVYPHLAATPKAARQNCIPKLSKPDIDGAAKHLIDQLTKLRFIVDDSRVCSLWLYKCHGPDEQVGITIHLTILGKVFP